MNPLKIINYAGDYYYQHYLLPKMYNIKYRKILQKNISLKNTKKGKRCFIIGGGPSLKHIDLSLLKDEETFFVNNFDDHPQYQALHPKNHVLIDTAYFTQGEDHFNTKKFIGKSTTLLPDTNIFINIFAKEFIEERNLFLKHKIFYIAMQGVMSDKFQFQIDIDKVVPWPKNSILMCLLISAYMGFNELYLLGVEHNFLSTTIGLKNSLTYKHSYEDERENIDTSNAEVVKRYATERDMNLSYEKQVANIKQLFKNYRLFKRKVEKMHPGITIYNATPESFLDVFPSIDFKNIPFHKPRHEKT